MNDTKVTRPDSLAMRVRRGVALLDEKVPGWHNRIDVATLELGDTRCCVVGQLMPETSFWTLCYSDWLGLHGRTEFEAHGFDVEAYSRWSEFDALTRLWRFVVRRRQAAAFFAHPDVQGNGYDLVYRLDSDGTVSCWSEKYGWHDSAFGNINDDSAYDRAHFADHLDAITVEQLPVGAR